MSVHLQFDCYFDGTWAEVHEFMDNMERSVHSKFTDVFLTVTPIELPDSGLHPSTDSATVSDPRSNDQ